MGSSQKGGGARTPYEAPNTLNSAQNIRIIDAISEGEIAGFAHGNNAPFKSIYFDDTPVQNADGSFNFHGVTGYFQVGTPDQSYIPNFDVSERTVSVSANIKKNTPIIRAISDNTVNRLRVTVGVERNAQVQDNGDTVPANTELVIELVNNSGVQASRHVLFNEKSSGAFYYDVVFDSLPAVPFNIRVRRLTADSTSDKVANNTFFASYVEMIDAKLSYPHTALSALKIDSDQFGNSVPRRNYLLRGKLLQVPSNYDPETRTYAGGLWDGSFKTAWSNNPAWIFYDLLTNERYSTLARRLTAGDIDKWALYQIAKYCDELVPDGFGGQEPRFVCNAYITDQRQAGELLNDLASVFCGLAVWNGNQISVMQDKHTDPVAVYSNANVVDGEFSYAGASLKAIHTAVHVRYADKHDGYRSKVEYIADDEAVARYGLNIKSVTAFGCDSRGQAVRFGTWILQTELRQQHTVSFSVGREGLKHLPYDVIRIADNDYAGAQLGGRVVAVSGDTITLDRDVAQAVGALLYYVDGKVLKNIKIIAQPKNNQVRVETVISIKVGDTWGLSGKVKSRLYRAVSIKENADDGTYTITALLHDPAKYGVVDESAIFDDAVATLHSATPELKNAAISTQDGSIILTWDNLTADGSVLDYDIKIYRNNQLYRHIPDAKTAEIALTNLPNGDYRAVIRGRNARGVYSTPLIKGWSINYTITGLRTTPKTMAIALDWVLPAIVVSDVVSEVWYGRSQDSSQAQLLAKLPYPQNSYLLTGVAVTDTFYFLVRLVDRRGNSGQFTTAVIGQADPDPAPIVAQITGAITESVLAQTLLDKLSADDATAKASAITETTKQVQAEATARATAIAAEANARANAITASANTQAASLRIEVGKLNTAIQAASTTAQANLTAKAAELTAKDNELKAQADNLLSQANDLAAQARQLGVKITAVERVNAEQAQQISTVTAAQGATAAALEEERAARASGDAAEAAARQTLAAEVGKNKAAIAAETKARADADKAEVAARTTLATRVGAAETAISAERTARTNADTAQTRAREALAAELTHTKAALENESKARVDGDKAEATARNALATRMGAAESAIGAERTARTNAIAAETRAREALAVRVGAAESGLSAERTARTNADTAQTAEINTAKARLGTAEGNIGTLQRTVADESRARAEQVNVLTARLGNLGSGGNLLPDTEFTNGMDEHHTGLRNNATVIIEKISRNGINAIRQKRFGVNANATSVEFARVAIGSGKVYQLSVYCRYEADNIDVYGVNSPYFRPLNSDLAWSNNGVASKRLTSQVVSKSAPTWEDLSQWHRYVVNVDLSASPAVKYLSVAISVPSSNGNPTDTDWLYWCKPMICEVPSLDSPEVAYSVGGSLKGVWAELTAFKTTQANKDTAQTSEINTAKSQIAGHTSEIGALKTTKADSSQVVALARNGLQSEWRGYTDTAKNAAEQTARQLNTATDAKVAALQQTVSNDRQAAATRHDSLSAKVDNLQVGGRNYLRSTGDLSNRALWRFSRNASQTATEPARNADVLTLTAVTAHWVQYVQRFNENPLLAELEVGEVYTLSFEAHCTITATDFIRTFIRQYHGSGSSNTTKLFTPSKVNEWIKYSHSFTVPARAEGFTGNVVVLEIAQIGTAQFRKVKLEKGHFATDWLPAPEDVSDAVAGVQSALDSHKTAQATADATQTAEINTAKSQINTNKSAIENIRTTKADKTEVVSLARTTLQSEWRNDVAAAETRAKQAAATDAQQKANDVVNALQIGGRNLILGSAKTFTVAAGAAANNESHKIRFNVTPNINWNDINSLVLSVDIKHGADLARAGSRWWCAGFEIPVQHTDDTWVYPKAAVYAPFTDAKNGRISFVFLPNKPIKSVKVADLLVQNIQSAEEIVLANPKLEIGNKATDWTPAPEDAEAAIGAVSASLESFKTTQANKDTAQTSEINTAKSQIAAHSSEINTLKTTKADSSQVVSMARTGLQAEWRGYTDTVKNAAIADAAAKDVVVKRDAATDAQTKATNAQNAAIAEAKKLDTATNAKVTALQKTVADNQSAMATWVSTVDATASGNTARITSTSDAVSALNGKVQALYSIKVESISNNRKVIAGLALGADGQTGDSQLLVYADKFGLVNPQSKAFDVPFAVNQTAGDAKMALKGDFIADGTIHGKHIAASQTIQSPVINAGTINGTTVNSGVFNGGQINIGNGNFVVDGGGNLTAKSGRFEGTVYANKIEGDILKSYQFANTGSQYELSIPPLPMTALLTFTSLSVTDNPPSAVRSVPEGKRIEIFLNGNRVFRRNIQAQRIGQAGDAYGLYDVFIAENQNITPSIRLPAHVHHSVVVHIRPQSGNNAREANYPIVCFVGRA